MSKAEERALEAYPSTPNWDERITVMYRGGFIRGYHQAEKDLTDRAKVSSGWDGFYYGQGYKQAEKNLELTWEDIGEIISINQQVCGVMGISDYIDNYQQAMEEVLKRFKERKEK